MNSQAFSNIRTYYLKIICFFALLILYSTLTLTSPKGHTGVNFEIYAESKSFIDGNFFILNKYQKFLGYDQAQKQNIFFSSHAPGISIINIPSAFFISKFLEPNLNKKHNNKFSFRESSKISVYLTNIFLFFFSIYFIFLTLSALKINKIKIIDILFSYILITPIFYFNTSGLRLSILSSLMIITFCTILLFLNRKEVKFLVLSGIFFFFITIGRESNYLFFVVPYFFLIFNLIINKKISKNFLLICIMFFVVFLLTILFLSLKNYYIIQEFSPFASRSYFDPRGPLKDPGYRETIPLISIDFSLSRIYKSIFNVNYGLIPIYTFSVFSLWIFSFSYKKINSDGQKNSYLIFLSIFILMFVFHNFIYFNKSGNGLFIGDRYIVPYLNTIYLISLILLFNFNNKRSLFIIFIMFAILENAKSFVLLITTPRSSRNYNSGIKFIDGHLMKINEVDYFQLKILTFFLIILITLIFFSNYLKNKRKIYL